jgi:hypothetical protein
MRRSRIIRHLSVVVAAAALATGALVAVAPPAFAAVPGVTTVAPANGSWQGGVSVTITGTGFFNGGASCAVTAVTFTTTFSAVPATFTPTCSDTSLVATSPNAQLGSAGLTADVTVTTPGGTSAVVAGDHFNYANCTFNGLAAGAVIQVTPGSSVSVNCTNLQPSASFLMADVSPVAGIVTPFSVSSDESLIMNNDPALPPSVSSNASGVLTTSLAVPIKTTGGQSGITSTDGDGVCPPTQDQVNQGLLTCAVAVANLSGTNFGNSLFEYPGQPSPQPPTLALSPTGTSTTTLTATGTGWWGAGGSTIPAANIRIGCTGTPCVGGTPAVSSNLTVTGSSYFITCGASNGPCTGPFTPSILSGTFDTGGATGTIAIDQPTTQPSPCSAPANCFPGNGPGGTTVEATASSTVPTATATGTGYTPWLGNSGCGGGASGCVANNAISNSGYFPDPTHFWQPAAGVDSSGTLNYQVDLPAATTVSAVTELWAPHFAPPTGYTIDTSPDGTTWTTQVTVSANTLRNRTDVFAGGQVPGVQHIRMHAITGFAGTACTGCGWSGLALQKFGWDGHGVVFPAATSPNTTVWNPNTFNDKISAPIISSVTSAGVNGTTAYGYVITAVNALGETLASSERCNGTSGSCTTGVNGNATLSASNFNAITWAAVPGAVSYNIYGRTSGSESLLGSVPVVNPPVLSCVAPCFNDTGQALQPATKPPTRGTVPSNALNNGGNQGILWQPTSSAAAGASYEVDLGAATSVSAATPTWSAFFTPPAAYEIDTSSNGTSWVPQFTTTTNTSQTATDVFPGGQVATRYLRVVINAPFPAAGPGYAGLGLVQFSWRPGAVLNNPIGDTPGTVTSPATPPTSSLFPQGYYPTTLPNSATANTTATWLNRVPDNGFSGGAGPGSTWGGSNGGKISNATSTTLSVTTSGSTTINSAASVFAATDVGKAISGLGIGIGAVVTVFTSATQITVSVPSTATSAVGTTVILSFGGTTWWQPVGAAGNTGNLTFAVDLGTPRDISKLTASWLNASFCTGQTGCAGFNPLTYQIFTSFDGTQNSWAMCANVTNSASNFTTSDTCTATGVGYVEYLITSWDATASPSFGPALNSLIVG